MNWIKHHKVYSLGVLLLIIAACGVIHQKLTAGVWWQWDQIYHHESIVITIVGVSIGLIVGKWIIGKRRKDR
jgi:uncharacterized membrane protein YqjE